MRVPSTRGEIEMTPNRKLPNALLRSAAFAAAGLCTLGTIGITPLLAVAPVTHRVSDGALADGDVIGVPPPRFSPDGEWIVWVQDAVEDGAFELWSARRGAGKAPTRLSADLANNRAVVGFEITPDSTRVVYVADQDANDLFELWSAPIAGGAAAVQLHANPVAGGDVQAFGLSADGTRAVFLADLDADDEVQLWSVPVEGPAAQADLLSPAPATAGGDVLVFAVTGAAAPRVVFAGTLRANGATEVWSVPLAGPSGQAARISFDPLPGTPGLALDPGLGFAVTPDGTRVVFAGAFIVADEVGLWSNAVAGSPAQAIELTPVPVGGGNVTAFRLAPNGARVGYVGDLQVDERFELWSAPVDQANADDKLSFSTPTAQGDVTHFVLGAGDPGQALFRADSQVDEQFDVWRRATDGAAASPTRLNPVTVPGADAETDLAVAPDGQDLVFRGNFAVADEVELWRAPANGGTGSAQRLNPNPPANGDVASFAIGPGSARVVFAGDVTTNDRVELWSVPIAGPLGQAIRLHPAPGANESVADYAIAPDGARVAFLADLTVEGRDAVWTVPTTGPDTAAVQAHPDAVANGAALAPLAWSADGLGVLFRGDLLVNDKNELWDADEWILVADFEEGDDSEWSSTVGG